MLQGTDLASLGDRYNVSTSELLQWRDAFLAGAEAQLSNPQSAAADEPSTLRRLVPVLDDGRPAVAAPEPRRPFLATTRRPRR